MRRIPFIDSHTGGEPTRLVLSGGPDLWSGTIAERAKLFRSRHDDFRAMVVEEPRGSDVFVGALLTEPVAATSAAGVVFFNNVDILGMCGHGTIGLVASLAFLGRLEPGRHSIETPVGLVGAELHEDGRVSVDNVPSWRYRTGVAVAVDGVGELVGDVAWGGNWFFLAPAPAGVVLEPSEIDRLVGLTKRARAALERDGVTGEAGALIDHVELWSPSPTGADCRTFVLCPGGAWDRSPCGTGTSAKLACLAADGALAPGETWRQESVIGSVFEGRYEAAEGGCVRPTITGRADVMAQGELLVAEDDPFAWGLPR